MDELNEIGKTTILIQRTAEDTRRRIDQRQSTEILHRYKRGEKWARKQSDNKFVPRLGISWTRITQSRGEWGSINSRKNIAIKYWMISWLLITNFKYIHTSRFRACLNHSACNSGLWLLWINSLLLKCGGPYFFILLSQEVFILSRFFSFYDRSVKVCIPHPS